MQQFSRFTFHVSRYNGTCTTNTLIRHPWARPDPRPYSGGGRADFVCRVYGSGVVSTGLWVLQRGRGDAGAGSDFADPRREWTRPLARRWPSLCGAAMPPWPIRPPCCWPSMARGGPPAGRPADGVAGRRRGAVRAGGGGHRRA